jgi:sugar phosphate isomerase/epimerase
VLAAAGFDYVEWPLREIAALDEGAYGRLREHARTLPLTPEAYNVMLPGAIKVTGPDADLVALERYLQAAYARAAELGGRVAVFGSGGSRNVPEGWGREDAALQLEEACRVAGDVAARHGLIIAVEPLSARESNLVNTVEEGAALVRRVDHPAVRVLSDLYHVAAGGESFEGTVSAGPLLAHVHVATPKDRAMPLPGCGGDVLARYFRALKAAGYDGRVSVEGGWSPEEAAAGAAYLRETWAGIGESG